MSEEFGLWKYIDSGEVAGVPINFNDCAAEFLFIIDGEERWISRYAVEECEEYSI